MRICKRIFTTWEWLKRRDWLRVSQRPRPPFCRVECRKKNFSIILVHKLKCKPLFEILNQHYSAMKVSRQEFGKMEKVLHLEKINLINLYQCFNRFLVHNLMKFCLRLINKTVWDLWIQLYKNWLLMILKLYLIPKKEPGLLRFNLFKIR